MSDTNPTTQIMVIFEEREYVINHGTKPRGRGSWAFSEKRCPTNDNIWWAPSSLTLAEAKRLATVHFRRVVAESDRVASHVVVYVQP